MSRRPQRAVLAFSCATLAITALAACGGSGSGTGNPSSSASADFVKFERCMREHGVHVEASTAGGPTRIKSGVNGSRTNLHTLEAASRACRKYSPGAAAEAKLTPAQKVAHEEADQKFAKCMREHGIKLETHTSTAGGGLAVRIGIHHQAGEGGPNRASPAFREAQNACQGLLPHPPKGD